MQVKDSILTYITEHKGPGVPVEAREIAEAFSIQRNMASHYLNRLADEGLLEKENTRPVLFSLPAEGPSPSKADLVFASFIGYDGSAAPQIERCKAAVTYPGSGLPLIIRGNSGVGKSFLASLIHQYAVSLGILAKDSPFVVLNCADYANNTELLSSILFGYVKGAFTGANEERTGLLDEADGGYLFLDEIHNLSAENQEKLFLFIDSQRFHRLGDSKGWKMSRARLIFATTEDIQSRLLSTFRRRIPLEIRLPDYRERSSGERFQLILHFLRQEAGILKKDLQVDTGLLRELLESRDEGNIGAIKNRIKVMCASAYNRQRSPKLRLCQQEASSAVFYEVPADRAAAQGREEDTLRRLLLRLPLGCLEKNSFAALEQALEAYTDQLRQEILAVYYTEENFWQEERVRCFQAEAGEHFRRVLRDHGLDLGTLEMKNLIMLLLTVSGSRALADVSISITPREQKQYFKHLRLAGRLLASLRLPDSDRLPNSLVFLTAAFLHRFLPIPVGIPAIILMHGDSSASSIARLANTIVGDYIYEAFDMPMEVGTAELVCQVNSCIEELDTRQGMAVLVDMGSLEQMYDQIKIHVEGDLVVVNNVSTALAIDIASKLKNGAGILDITGLDCSFFQAKLQFYKGISRKPNVVVSCISGEGIAEQLRDILSAYVNSDIVDVVTMNYGELRARLEENDRQIFKNTMAVLTTSAVSSPLVPVIHIEDIVDGSASLKALEQVLRQEDLMNLTNDIIKMFTLKGAAARLNFLNPEKVINQVEQVIGRYEQALDVHFPSFLRVNLFLHISIMIERIMIKESRIEDRFWKELADQPEVKKFTDLSEDIFKQIMARYKLEIPRQEYTMIYQIIRSGLERPAHRAETAGDE